MIKTADEVKKAASINAQQPGRFLLRGVSGLFGHFVRDGNLGLAAALSTCEAAP